MLKHFTESALNEFKNILRRSVFLSKEENELFEKIPDIFFEKIFSRNFNGNINFASRIILNKYDEVDAIDKEKLEKEKNKIFNLTKASLTINDYLNSGKKIIFITDNDSDGSLSQAILIEYLKLLPESIGENVVVEYAQPIGKNRGLTKEIVNLAADKYNLNPNDDFLIITADNGINNVEEQIEIQKNFPKSKLIITDHHLPHEKLSIVENDNTIIFNPNYKKTEYFEHRNISGANTLSVLLKESFKTNKEFDNLRDSVETKIILKNIQEISEWANLLDYVESDIADKPLRPYIVEKAQKLQPLLNISNSLNTLITGNISEHLYKIIKDTIPDIDIQVLKDSVKNIKAKNILAHKLLNIYQKYTNDPSYLESQDISIVLSEELVLPYDNYNSINPNYIEQLRPYIFNISAIDNKTLFLSKLNDLMVNVYEDLRDIERTLQQELRKGNLLSLEKMEFSTILYPVEPEITQAFNRKFLGKTYNEENNGLLLTLDKIDKTQASGSFRSLYNITDILKEKKSVEDEFNIELDFQGHEKAAGFFIRSKDPKQNITKRIINGVNLFINDRILELKDLEQKNELFIKSYLHIDLKSVDLLKKLNHAVKANISNMIGIPAVIKFNNYSGVVYVTDPKTTEQISLNDVISKKKYGYQAILTDFDGGAIIVPIELLRGLSQNKYSDFLTLNYIAEGAFMGDRVESGKELQNIYEMKAGRKTEEELLDYYRETYKESNFIQLDREYFKKSPYFMYNIYGIEEFNRFENFIISLLDKTDMDVLAVTDTEGTGLGKSPKCLNIGATNIQINEDSGTILSKKELDENSFIDESGQTYYLSKEQSDSLLFVDENEDIDANLKVLIKSNIDGLLFFSEKYEIPSHLSINDFTKVENVKMLDDDKVIINRTISGFAYSFLIKNNDFKMSQEFTDLTGVSNWMLNRVGISANSVDERLVEYYENLKNKDGSQKKVIFQAHNMPYDKSVIASNFQKFNQLMEKDGNLISDTAKIARLKKLAYDNTPVANFEEIDEIPSKLYFYNSQYSDFSLEKFFLNAIKNESGVYPDRTGKFVLKYSSLTKKYSLIDKEKNNEIELKLSTKELLEAVKLQEMPNNAVKYSVEKMSQRAMVRNIILSGERKLVKNTLSGDEKVFEKELNLFQELYHFDSSIEKNVHNFYQAIGIMDEDENFKNLTDFVDKVDLKLFAQKFLIENKEIQAKFHDGWIYEKVLEYFEPNAKKDITNDAIDQIKFYTDFPKEKIKQVLEDTLLFKNKFKIKHAMVHEQHNNIVQTSDDGQGLSDTAYESILPQLLTMTKEYNPYFNSYQNGVSSFVRLNIVDAMRQLTSVDELNKDLALDSYSVTQIQSFRRNDKTDMIKNIQDKLNSKSENEVIKFKLGGEVLPPDSGVYAKTIGKVDRNTILEDAEKIKFIMTNEQVKSSVIEMKIPIEEKESLLNMFSKNDAISKSFKDDLLERYEFVEFSRKDHRMKKCIQIIKDSFDGKVSKISKSLYLSEGEQKVVMSLIERHIDIEKKIYGTMNFDSEAFQKVVDSIPIMDDPINLPDMLSIRDEKFLPFLDIVRRDPMKFSIKILGTNVFNGVLHEQLKEMEPKVLKKKTKTLKP